MRYKLLDVTDPTKPMEMHLPFLKSKQQIADWRVSKSVELGFEWSVGARIKFRTSPAVYEWVKLNGDRVK
jgi:hypothetical protein